MKGNNWILSCLGVLCLSVSANASRVVGSSSYGLPGGAACTGTLVCSPDISSDPLTVAADIVPQVYLASAYGGKTYAPPDSPFG